MGYGTTIVMIIFGLSVSFYFYAAWVNDPVTQMYSSADAGKISNISAQSGELNDQLQSIGMAAQGNVTTNLFMNTITGSFIGLTVGSIASILTGGGFATVYIIPAMALGGIIGMLTQPLDMIDAMMIGVPSEMSFVFKTFMYLLFFIFVIAFIRGDM